jgi:hypothetical protein
MGEERGKEEVQMSSKRNTGFLRLQGAKDNVRGNLSEIRNMERRGLLVLLVKAGSETSLQDLAKRFVTVLSLKNIQQFKNETGVIVTGWYTMLQ